MIAQYNTISLAFGVPGIVIRIGGYVAGLVLESPTLALAGFTAGSALLTVGLCYYAMAKGRSPALGLLGLFGLIGLIVLGILKDMSKEPSPAAEAPRQEPQQAATQQIP
jgi:hypothetical protein